MLLLILANVKLKQIFLDDYSLTDAKLMTNATNIFSYNIKRKKINLPKLKWFNFDKIKKTVN